MERKDELILWFEDISSEDIPIVGGKAASLGELIQHVNTPVPPGFAITTNAYRLFIEHNQLDTLIASELQKISEKFAIKANIEEKIVQAKLKEDKEKISKLTEELQKAQKLYIETLQDSGERIRTLIAEGDFPEKLEDAITEAYNELGQDKNVAVRSSATAEDLPSASFAGQQETFLCISSVEEVLKKVIICFSSLHTNRAISYREEQKRLHQKKAKKARKLGDMETAEENEKIVEAIDHVNVGISVAVQIMIRSDLASSGVIFTIDTETGYDKAVLITGAYGLGETIVQGKVIPDQYFIYKPTLSLIDKQLGQKDIKLVYKALCSPEEIAAHSDDPYTEKDENIETVLEIPTTQEERETFCISNFEALELADMAILIEKHYGVPMDIEWAKDGRSGKLYIVQARPETVHSRKGNVLKAYALQELGEILITGQAIGQRIGQGKANIITGLDQLSSFIPGEVLVTDMTTPDFEPIMKVASAIVTNRGGRTCHAAIVSRELGIPCVIGTKGATEVISDGMEITVDGSEGVGRVFRGLIPFKISEIHLDKMPKTKTKIMLNIGMPENAFAQSFLPHDGVGLAREEFIFTEHIKVHPLALLNFTKLVAKAPDHLKEYAEEAKQEIAELTAGYEDKKAYFVDKLAMGIAKIGAAFAPKEVIFRLSDFKTNEYEGLVGGKLFEPHENNPMIGWRGCSRYYDQNFVDAFRMEVRAFAKVRNEMGLHNVVVMYPFCRTPAEADKVTKILSEESLVRGEPEENPLKVFCMAEIPSNIILADEFAKRMDGFSIGSNDLTQLILGLDRDSELVAHLYDERNEGVKRAIRDLINKSNVTGTKVGICGQAPSDFPSFAAFLIEAGIDSMSLNPDTLIQTRGLAYVVEQALEEGKRFEDIEDAYIRETLKPYPGLDELVIKMINLEKMNR